MRRASLGACNRQCELSLWKVARGLRRGKLDMEPSNQTKEPLSTSMPSPSLPSQVLDNSTMATHSTFDVDIIAANDMMSTANYIYALLAALSLVSACFLLYSFIQTYRAQRPMAWLDCLFWAFCGSQLLLVFLSLSSVVYRPGYLMATQLACAALSFSINVASLCGLLLLVLMAYVLTFDQPSHTLLGRPGVSVSLVALVSVLSSVMLAALRWPSQELEPHCIIDPLVNGLSYAVAKFCLSFIIPCLLLLGLLIAGCVRQWKSRGRFLSGSEEGPVFLTLAVVLLLCQLFYNVVLLKGIGPKEGGIVYKQALLSVAESVLFAGSAVSLLLVLFMHRLYRESLKGALRQLRDCCRSLGGAQTRRHITDPHIEITDTLQDYNSQSLK